MTRITVLACLARSSRRELAMIPFNSKLGAKR
jgi:hypothetical protein